MNVQPVKTRVVNPPKDDLFAVLDESIVDLRDGDVLVVTSKVVAIHQGRCVRDEGQDIKELAEREADAYVRAELPGAWGLFVKEHAILANAGIDRSNAHGYFVLLPERPSETAREIRRFLTQKFKLSRLGVVISDSHSIPFHLGTMGVAIGLSGFHPVRRLIGTPDLFGRLLKFTRIDVVDSLAAAGTFAIGEAAEQTPLAIVRNAPHLDFTDEPTESEMLIPPEQDIYYPLLKPLYEKSKKKKERR